MRTILILALVFFLIYKIETKEKRREDFRHPIFFTIILYVLVFLVSSIFSISPSTSFFGSYIRSQGFFTLTSYILLFFFIFYFFKEKSTLYNLIDTAIILSLPISFYGILQCLGMDPLSWTNDITKRVVSTMGNPIFFSAYLILVIPLTMGCLLKEIAFRRLHISSLRNSISIFLYTIVLISQLTGIILTKSRGPFIGIFCGIFLFIFILAVLNKIGWLKKVLLIPLILIPLIIIILNLNIPLLKQLKNTPVLNKISDISKIREGTAVVRFLIWENSLKMALNSPSRFLLGYGPETMILAYVKFYPPKLATLESADSLVDRSHNKILDLLVTTGFIGVCVFFYLIIQIFYLCLLWLGLIPTPGYKKLLISLITLVSFSLTTFFCLIFRSFKFLPLGLSLGIFLGIILYLFFIRSQDLKTRNVSKDKYLFLGFFCAFMAHFLETQFGISIASTNTYFWFYLGVFLNLSLLKDKESVVNVKTKLPSEKEGRKKGRKKKEKEEHIKRSYSHIILSWVTAVILTVFYAEVVVNKNVNLTIFGIIFFIVLVFNGIYLLVKEDKEEIEPNLLINKLIIYFIITLSTLLCYIFVHSIFLSGSNSESFPFIFYSFIIGIFFLYPFFFIFQIKEKTLFTSSKLIFLYPILLIIALFIIKKRELNPVTADIYFKQAKALMESKRYDESVIYYRKALELVPYQDLYYTFLGEAAFNKAKSIDSLHLKTKSFKACNEAFEKAREINPLSPNHTGNLGVLMQEWGKSLESKKERLEKFQNSINYFKKASKITPYNFRLYRDWGMTYFYLGRYKEAIDKYNYSIKLNWNQPKTLICLGDAYRLSGDFKNAKDNFKKAIYFEPKNISVYHTLSYLYFEDGEIDKAIEINRKVLKINSRDLKCMRNLIFLYEKILDYEKAIEVALNAIKYAPEEEKVQLKKLVEHFKEKLKRR
jgi:tetratricopeptide (TPR) repeat protein/O-antigen ligase